MKTRSIRRFPFDEGLHPEPPVPFRGSNETDLDRLKKRLLQTLLSGEVPDELQAGLRRAANDAASIAWLSPYPLLVFPGLLEENARAALRRYRRQKRVQSRSRVLLRLPLTEGAKN